MNRVYIFKEIDDRVAEITIRRLRFLHQSLLEYEREKELDWKVPIHIYLNSDGGCFDATCAIIDEMYNIGKLGRPVYTIAQGKAYSSAGFILCSGEEAYATPNSIIMLHPPSIELDYDKLKNQKTYTTFSESHFDAFLKKIAARRNKRFKNFKEEIEDDLWMSVSEAKKRKIIDDIWDYKKWEIYE